MRRGRKKRKDTEAPDIPVQGLGDLPDAAQQLMGKLPQGFQDALAQAPPEVRQQLEGFGDLEDHEQQLVTDGVDLGDLTDTLAQGGSVPVSDILAQLPEGTVEGIDVSDQTMFVGASIQRPEQNTEVRFARDDHGPGDTVEGVLVVRKPMKAKDVHLELCYVNESSDYVERTTFASVEKVHQGRLEPGTEIAFSFVLPPDAMPNWDPGGAVRLLAGAPQTGVVQRPELANYGRLYWAVNLTATRRGFVAHDHEHHPIPLRDDPEVWRGPQPAGEEGEIQGKVKGWDVDMAVRPFTLRRGEEVTVDLTIDDPSPERTGLWAGLVCELHHDVESRTTSTDSDGSSHETTSRVTHVAEAHEEWVQVDASSPIQQLRLRVPEDAPFSFGEGKGKRVGSFNFSRTKRRGAAKDGLAFAVEWRVVVREDRRMRRDPRREARLLVRP